jgi:hypothetical protein
MITEFGYFVISEVLCMFPCVWVRGGNFTFFLFYLRLLPTSFCNVFVRVRLGLLSLYAIRPSAVFLARLCWYCWFHRASSSPLIVGSLVPGSMTAGWGVWAVWHSPHRASNGARTRTNNRLLCTVILCGTHDDDDDAHDRKMQFRFRIISFISWINSMLNPSSLLFIACTTKFNIQKSYVLPTQRIYVFCVDLRTNSDYFLIQH